MKTFQLTFIEVDDKLHVVKTNKGFTNAEIIGNLERFKFEHLKDDAKQCLEPKQKVSI